MERLVIMTNQELMEQWNRVQIKLNDCISRGDYVGVDHCTTITTGLIPQMLQAGIDITGLLR